MVAKTTPPPVPAAALPGRDRHPVRGRDRAADPRGAEPARRTPRCCSARSPTSTSRPSTVTSARARPRDGDAVRLPDRGGRREPVLLRQRPLRRVRPRHEEHRRRARAARPDLRRLRAGRARSDARRERRPPAHLRGRRRRPDRCRDGRPDRRARRTAPCKRDFRAINTRQARVDPASTRAGQVLPPFGAKLGEQDQDASSRSSASRCMLGAMVTDVDERGLEVKFKDGRVERIDRRHQDLGGRRPGQLARPDALRADRRPARPRRPDRRQPRPHAARSPRGVRGRRHDRPRPPARRRAGRHPGREVRREGDRPPAGGQAAAEAVQVLRQGLDGDHQPVPGGRADRPASGSPACSPGCSGWACTSSTSPASRTGSTALLHWAVSFLGRGRPERTTTEQQIFARPALQPARARRRRPGLRRRTRTTAAQEILEAPSGRARGAAPSRRRGSPTPASAASRSSSVERGGAASGHVVVGLEHAGERAGVDHGAVDHEGCVGRPLDEHPPLAAAR